MKSRVLLTIFSICMLLTVFPVLSVSAANSGSCGTNVRWALDDAGTLTISGTGAMTDYSSYDSVPWAAFRNSIKTIIIGDGVTHIGSYTLGFYTELTTLFLGDSVTGWGKNSFAYCDSLTAIYVDESNRYYCSVDGVWFEKDMTTLYWYPAMHSNTTYTIPNGVNAIWGNAFRGCSLLTEVTIPNSVTSIGSYAFSDCPSLNAVTIPNSVTSIENSSFSGCSSLNTVTIPNSVTSIGNSSFSGCSSLNAVTISDGVTSIGERAFYECSSLTEIVIPDSVTSIGNEAFENCASLVSVTVPSGVSSIGSSTFYGCNALASVTIPDSVTSIGSSAFYSCYSLTLLHIPNSVTSIGNSAFNECTALSDIYYDGTSAQWDAISIGSSNVALINATRHFSDGSATPALSGACGDGLTWTLESGVLTISGTGAMTNYSYGEAPWYGFGITRVVIGDGVTSIGNYAFDDCRSLNEAEIPDSVTSIGYDAFNSCFALAAVDIPDGVTYIGSYAFRYCRSLTAVTIPDNVKSIGEAAFSACTKLTSIHVGENNAAYSSLNGVLFNKAQTTLICYPAGGEGSYSIPDSVTCIGYCAFSNCESLISVIIPNTVTKIRGSAFARCSSLVLINIPNSVTSIGDFAFDNCAKLAAITIPDSVTTIGEAVFQWCAALVSVTIPDSVTNIADWAFNVCSKLTDVYYGGTAEEWKKVSIGSYNTSLTNAAIHYTDKYAVTVTSGTGGGNYAAGKAVTITADETVEGRTFSGWSGADDLTFTSGDETSATATFTMPEQAVKLAATYTYFGTCGTDVTWTFDKDGLLTISGTGAMTDYAWSNPHAPWYGYRTSIKSVVVEDGVTYIGQFAFSECSATTVTIPSSVTGIGHSLTDVCQSLLNFEVDSDNANYCSVDGVLFTKDMTTLVAYPIGRSDSAYIIPDGVTTIEFDALSWSAALTNVTIPDSVTSIGVYAFGSCTLLTDIYYNGTAEQWCAISIDPDNAPITGSATTIHCNGAEFIYFGTCGADVTWTLDKDGLLTIRGTGEMTYYRYRGAPWYNYRTSIQTAVIADGVTTIGGRAFDECTSLKSVTLPNSVTMIDEYAFAVCGSLTSITLAEGITAIKLGAFVGSGLTAVTIPNSVTSIGKSVFNDCSALTDVYYNGTAEQWHTISIESDNALLIGGAAIVHCNDGETGICGTKLKWKLDSAGSLTIFGTGAMTNWSSDSAVPWYGFHDGIKALSIGSDVTSIGAFALYDCAALTSVSIPDSVASIGNYTFYDCTGMTTVTISRSVTSMGRYAFQNCSKLLDVYYGGTETEWRTVTSGLFGNGFNRATIHYGQYAVTVTNGSGSGNYMAGADVTVVADTPNNKVFTGWSGADDLTFTSGDKTSVTATFTMPAKAVVLSATYVIVGGSCGDGVNWSLDNGLLTISGTGAMTDWSRESAVPWYSSRGSIQMASIGAGVTSVGGYAFVNCTALTTIEVNADNTAYCSMDGVLFTKDRKTLVQYPAGKSNTDYEIPTGVERIGHQAFRCCAALTEVTIPNSVTSIGDVAFYDCVALTDVNYGGTTEQWRTVSVGASNTCLTKASIYCDNFSDIVDDPTDAPTPDDTCGASLTWTLDEAGTLTISGTGKMTDWSDAYNTPWYAFCADIKTLVIEDGVTSIGRSAMNGCGNLTSVTIPISVTSVGKYAFNDCADRLDVYYNGTETNWAAVRIGMNNEPLCGANIYFQEEDADAPRLVVESKMVRAGEMVTVSVSIRNNPGMMTFNLGFAYDSGLTLRSVEKAAGLEGIFHYDQTAVYIQDTDIAEDCVLVTLTFEVSPDAEEDQHVTITSADVSNHNEETIALLVIDGNVMVENYTPGDINGYGDVNLNDLVRFVKYISGEAVEVAADALDVNGDGKVTMQDLVRLLKYLSGENVEIF